MRKVITLMHLSLDGFAAAPDEGLDWTVMDDEMYPLAAKLFADVDTAIYGRKTYEGMYGYWPTVPGNPESTPDERVHAEWVEHVAKVVFSTTLQRVDWNNSRLIKSDLAGEINTLKRQPGKSLMIFGSPRLVHAFMEHDLIDEYRLFIDPVLLGAGLPFFNHSADRIRLTLIESKTFRNGVVHVAYERA